MKKNRSGWGSLLIATVALGGIAQALGADGPAREEHWDFTGHVAFDVSSTSGRVERVAVTVGDGGTGHYPAILSGDPSLPTHTLYRPRDLRPFGPGNRLPVVAFANGGCRDSSGEFRNFLSDIASHGYLVIAIGPASDAAVDGSEDPTAITRASQLTDAIDWAAKAAEQSGSPYYHRLALDKVAVAGQSCGGIQALAVSPDPRVTATLVLNSSARIASPASTSGAAPTAASPAPNARGEYGRRGQGAAGGIVEQLNEMAHRYDPYLPLMSLTGAGLPDTSHVLEQLHAPVLYLIGGPRDLAYPGAARDFAAISSVPVVMLNEDVGHYPGTYREPNGGDFATAAVAWLDWRLRGSASARRMFVGAHCGFCQSAKWRVQVKNMPQ